MGHPDRRLVLAGPATMVAAPRSAHAAAVREGAGREIAIPAKVERGFPAGPPAAMTRAL
ncbi:hypothetical protein [Bosea psychrotolerans]|uniref:Uncharacterized protein n=1 Tax=Bosea psychrotolerans TaxID=1871628 RepID=A0A2S4MBB0_9HYPH|nr:hypothetical protein [Bosea psychrotolerans]POR52022.1 hypothetical protein CYD53_106312 [Bosea psychrotolerans]